MPDFADKSGQGVLLTEQGNAQLSPGDYKFSGASLLLDGTGDYVTINNSNASIDLSDREFTIDLWFKRTDSAASERVLISRWDFTAGDYRCWKLTLRGDASHVIEGSLTTGGTVGTATTVQSTTTYNDTNWHHVALVRSGDTLMLFVDGILEDSDTFVGAVLNSGRDAFIGADDAGSNFFQGYIDEVRIVKNRAIWTTNFLVPVAPQAALGDGDVLVMPADGSNGSTTFKDVSPATHTLTANGGAQISTSHSKFGDSSAYLNGTNAYISASDSNDWYLSTEDFTIDAWVRLDSVGAAQTILSHYDTGSDKRSFLFSVTATDKLQFEGFADGAAGADVTVTSTGSLSVNTWHHVAAVRHGSSWKLYIDGSEDGSASYSGGLFNAPTDLRIGCHFEAGGATAYYEGYIEEMRITKGTARWTERFVPPIRAYPRTTEDWGFPQDTDDYTVLLLHFNGSNGDTSTDDYSQTRHAMSFYTNAEISTATSKFGGSSLYVDDTSGSRVEAADSDDWNFGSDPWTIECWLNLTATGANNTVIAQLKSTDSNNWWRIIKNSSEVVEFRAVSGGSDAARYSFSPSLGVGTWYHLVWEYDGSDIRAFLDGVEQTLTETSAYTGTMPSSGNPLTVGTDGNGASPFNGYLDEVRISKGYARYTEDFQPQEEQFPEAQDESIKLLLHMESVNGVSYIKDSSYRRHNVFPENGTTLSTAQYKFGERSCYFDHSDDYLLVPDSDDWTFEDGEFTIDLWWRPEDVGDNQFVFSIREDAENIMYLQWVPGTTSFTFELLESNVSIVSLTGSVPLFSAGTWHHIAVLRTGNDWKIFVDGTQEDSSTVSHTMKNLAGPLYIGQRGDSAFYVNGYIDEFRVTKGVTRWTAAFTVPSRAQPDYM